MVVGMKMAVFPKGSPFSCWVVFKESNLRNKDWVNQ
jgi:hypothetical protein